MAVYLEGPPGTGKTSISKQVAEQMGLPLIYQHAPTKLPEDFGLPWPDANSNSFHFRMLKILPLEGSEHPDEGIMLFDELAQAGADIQKILANMLWEREVHGHRIKPGWRFIATGNRMSDRAGANRILSHLRNRMITLDLDVEAEAWCDWAQEHGVDERIIAYLRFAPQHLNTFDANQEINATPRSWAEGLSPILPLLTPDILLETAKGIIGSVAPEFTGFLGLYGQLPSREEFLANPEQVVRRLPKNESGSVEPSIYYALANMLLMEMTIETFLPAMEAASHLPMDCGAMVFMSYLKKCSGAISRHPQATAEGLRRYKGILLGEQVVKAEELLGEAA